GCILSYTFGHTNSFSALPLPLTHTFFLISPVLPPSLSLCAHLCISSLFLTPSLSLSLLSSLPPSLYCTLFFLLLLFSPPLSLSLSNHFSLYLSACALCFFTCHIFISK